MLVVAVEGKAPVDELVADGTVMPMLKGTRRRSICVFSMSGEALPIDAAAAIDWSSVEMGGTAAARARMRNVDEMKLTPSTSKRN